MTISVLYDDQVFFRQRFGGISRYFSELHRHLKAENGIDPISAFLCTNNEHYHQANPGKFRCPRRGQRFVRKLNDTLLKRSLCRAHIWHPTYYEARQLTWKRSTRVVVTVYDMIPEMLPQFFPDGNPHLEKKRYCDAADVIVCISEQTRKDLIDVYDVTPSKAITIHLGASPTSADLPSEAPNSPPYFVFIGNRAGYKNFGTLLMAFATVVTVYRDCRLLCLGGGRLATTELEAIKRLGLGSAVQHLDASDNEIARYLRGAVAFVFPTLYEGFGLPVVEAFAAECPVVLSDTGCLREVGGDAALYFDPLYPESCAQAMMRVMEDSEGTVLRKKQGRQRAKEFSWERTAKQHAHLYRALAAVA